MNDVIVGLGSNIEPEYNLPEALRRLAGLVKIEAVSSLWETAAVGSDGPAFLNAAALLITPYDAIYLKENVLWVVETSLGRVRTADKNAPRTIDLDILVFNQEVIDKAIFHLDHLILPLAELVPDLHDPETEKSMQELAVEHCCKPTAMRVGKFLY
jgi:2-amino-4-hydroxy-6-hydroxymethyldihydropteridine diphosphokinase